MPVQTRTASRLIEVLMVEDNRADVTLMKEVFKDAAFPLHLRVAWDGVEALEFLERRRRQSFTPLPDVILLDLHLPRKDGLAVLEEIKGNTELENLPVFIMTTSTSEADIEKAYRLKADFYFVKPMEMDYFSVLLKHLENIWAKKYNAGQPLKGPLDFQEPAPLEEVLVVTNKLGLNLRFAAELVKVSSRFKSRVVVEKNGCPTDGKSLIGLISLAVVYGSKLKFNIQGEDAPEALEAIRELVHGKFGERE